MGFDAAAVVEPLDWNFEKFGAGKGVIPEPSEAQVKAWQRAIRRVMTETMTKLNERSKAEGKEETDTSGLTPREFIEALGTAESDAIVDAANEELDRIYVKFCGGSPSAEQLGRLPYRYKIAFYAWLQEEFSPEASSAAGKSKPRATAATNNGAFSTWPGGSSA